MVLKSELLLFEYKEFWKKPLKIAFLADFSITLIKGLYLFLLFFGKNCHSKVEQFYFLISCRDSPKIHLNCHIKLTQLLIPWFFGLYPHCLCEERKGGKSHYWSLLRSEDDWYSLEGRDLKKSLVKPVHDAGDRHLSQWREHRNHRSPHPSARKSSTIKPCRHRWNTHLATVRKRALQWSGQKTPWCFF